MNVQIENQENNNQRRFNNHFNLDPNKQDICIEKRINKDLFIPLFYFCPNFGILNRRYSIIFNEPLKESFFHLTQAFIFPNASPLQISMIMCYLITIMFIVSLCFGLDNTNMSELLQVKLPIVDMIGSFYPKRIRKNPWEFYRLLTYHFLHFNFEHYMYSIINLLIYCTFFEVIVKKHVFLLIFFLTGIFSNLAIIYFFKDDARSCGMNYDINGIEGAFIMLLIMNWSELRFILGSDDRFLILLIISVYSLFNNFIMTKKSYINAKVNVTSIFFGAFIFSVVCKPIRPKLWKTILRIFSGILVLTLSIVSLVAFFLKEKN